MVQHYALCNQPPHICALIINIFFFARKILKHTLIYKKVMAMWRFLVQRRMLDDMLTAPLDRALNNLM